MYYIIKRSLILFLVEMSKNKKLYTPITMVVNVKIYGCFLILFKCIIMQIMYINYRALRKSETINKQVKLNILLFYKLTLLSLSSSLLLLHKTLLTLKLSI